MADNWCLENTKLLSSCNELLSKTLSRSGAVGPQSPEMREYREQHAALQQRYQSQHQLLIQSRGSLSQSECNRRQQELNKVSKTLETIGRAIANAGPMAQRAAVETVDTMGRTNRELLQQQKEEIARMENEQLDSLNVTLDSIGSVAGQINDVAGQQVSMVETIGDRMAQTAASINDLCRKCDKVRYAAKKTSWLLAAVNGLLIGVYVALFVYGGKRQ